MKPFVKWVGGKTQLLEQIRKRLPKKYNNYIEPFVGSGAVLFYLSPSKAIINDINKPLMNTYLSIKNHPKELIDYLSNFDSQTINKKSYLIMRQAYNEKIQNNEYDVELASLFIQLNKRCFNGLYRVNSKDLFNVPFNNKENVKTFDQKNIFEIHHYLKNVELCNTDFEEVAERARKGDFVFFDSPYAPLSENTFEAYTKEGFSYEDHLRLAKVFESLDKKGCFLMLTNHNTKLINDLYQNYKISIVPVKRLINCITSKRKGEEVIITNYKWED